MDDEGEDYVEEGRIQEEIEGKEGQLEYRSGKWLLVRERRVQLMRYG